MEHPLGNLFFEDLRCNERRSTGNYPLVILIGGDRGDVEAKEALSDNDGMWLENVTLHSSWIGLSAENMVDTARDIVLECYASIQEDTFNQTRKKE